ncbi:MAG: sugar phosphate nucleotidyltransferase [Acidobacteria bacterium]|nr:sugar phosphate nucleotidyltransferase [Acidobacteriota bacterium]
MTAGSPRPTAVILLAGRSQRTWPLTADFPKPLLPLWGRPLTERVLDQLRGVVDTAVLVVGYQKERILDHFGTRYAGIRLVPVEQKSARGTADALRVAAAAVRGPVLVLNGDDFYHHDDLARVSEHPTAILCKEASDPWNRATVTVTEDDWLVDVQEKPPAARPWELSSVGAYSLRREDLDHLGEVRESVRGELELPDLIRILARSPGVRAVRARRPWIPLTYPWDVIGRIVPLFGGDPAGEGARALGFETSTGEMGEGAVFVGEGASVHSEARLVGPVELGAGARIGAGAEVERAVLMEGASVGAGAIVRDSVLGRGASIGEGARLRSGPVERIQVLEHTARVGVPVVGACLGAGASVAAGAETPPGTLLGPGELFG